MFINAVFWILRTGAPWRDLPLDYGGWSNTHRRFIRWQDKGIWEKLLEVLIEEPDDEWLMIDASHCKVHPHAAGQGEETRTWAVPKGAQHPDTSAVDAQGMPIRAVIASGIVADCTQASRLIEGIDADHLIADTPKTPNPSSPPFKSDASPFGLVSRDYTIYFLQQSPRDPLGP